jgi:hypothetical protein
MISAIIHIQSILDSVKRIQNYVSRRQVIVALVLCSMFILVTPSLSQTTRNGGILNITTPHTYTNFQNYNTAGTAGTVNITSTMTVTATLNNNKAGAAINNNAAGTVAMTGTTGDYNNGAGATNNSTATSIIKIGNTLTLGAGAFTTTSGEVQFTKAGAQTIPSGVASATYAKLTTSGSGTKSLGGSVIVSNQVNIGAGTTFDVVGNTLTLNGTTPFTGTGTFTATTANATVIYNASGAQNVLSTSYYNLTLQNTNTKSAQGAITVVNGGSLSVAGSTTFDLVANILTLQMTSTSAVTNNGTIQTAATGTGVSVAAAYQIGGTFIYNAAAGSQTVAAVNYNNLTYVNAGATRAMTGTVGIAGTFTVAGTRTYTGSTVNYNGSATFGSLAQNIIGGEGYNNLGVSGGVAQADTATRKTVTTGNLTLNSGTGILTIAANTNLDMLAFTGSWNSSSTLQSTSKIMWQASNAYVGGSGVTEFYGISGGSVAQGTNYGNMLFSGNGLMTFATAGTTTATGNVTVNSGAQITVNNSVVVQVNGSMNAAGNVANNGTVNVGP